MKTIQLDFPKQIDVDMVFAILMIDTFIGYFYGMFCIYGVIEYSTILLLFLMVLPILFIMLIYEINPLKWWQFLFGTILPYNSINEVDWIKNNFRKNTFIIYPWSEVRFLYKDDALLFKLHYF